MSVFLLDVNVLVALMWPTHESHSRTQQWFAHKARHGWATCPFTQAGFVRVVSNPAFSPDAVSPQQAVALLVANLKHRSHRFWSDDLTVDQATERFRLAGHRQVTDAYLLGLAIRRKGKLATMDRAVLALLPAEGLGHDLVEII